jgi:hypothetical protein
VTELDLITLVRGYQTYDPRDEETTKALKVIITLPRIFLFILEMGKRKKKQSKGPSLLAFVGIIF